VKSPPSLPALIYTVNAQLKKDELSGHITEILQGVRRHITIIFDQVIDEQTSTVALQEVLKGFNMNMEAVHVLDRTTHSILKFNTIPTITTNGCPVTAEAAATCLK